MEVKRMLALSQRSLCLVALTLIVGLSRGELPPDRDNRARQPTQEEKDRQEALKLFTKALLQKSDHKYLEAVRTLEEARRLDPQAAGIHKTLATLHQLLDHREEAVKSYRKAVELDPEDGEAWFHFAQVLRLQNSTKEAAEALVRGVKAESLAERPADRYAMLLELGDIWEELKEPAKAADTFEQAWTILSKPEQLLVHAAIEADQVLPRSSELLERIGRNAALARQFDRAITAFGKAQQVYPENKPRLSLNRAEVYLLQEDYERALKAVNAYLESKPQGTEGYERKIVILRKLKRDVVQALEAHLSEDRDNTSLRLLYARELANAGKFSAAKEEYAKLAKEAPDADVYRGLFSVYRKTSGGKEILESLDSALKKFSKDEGSQPAPEPLELARAQAMLAALREDAESVKTTLDAASAKIATGELTLKTRLTLAALADHTKQLDQAEKLYRSCLKSVAPGGRSEELEAYIGLLNILWRQRNYEGIVDVCEQGLKNGRRINRVMLYDDLARALDCLGKTEEALQQADKAVEAAGAREALYARRMRARLLAETGQYEKAIEECQGLLKDYKDVEDIREIRNALSQVYTLAREYDKAEEQLKIIIEGNPKDATSHNDLGYLWADEGKNLVEAEKLVRRALELDHERRESGQLSDDEEEDRAAYLDSLGWVLLRQGKPRAALVQLERACKMASGVEDPVIWDHLGDAYSKVNEKDKARAAYRKAVEFYDAGRRRKSGDRYKELKEKLKLLEAP
jgi:tetratricopeptide (TPR) repeat protein